MTDLNAVELHDAVLRSASIDYVAKTMMISIEFYKDANHDSHRIPARIIFEGVNSISHVGDLDILQDHASAGNIESWLPNADGTTYLYFVQGSIAVCAQVVRFES